MPEWLASEDNLPTGRTGEYFLFGTGHLKGAEMAASDFIQEKIKTYSPTH